MGVCVRVCVWGGVQTVGEAGTYGFSAHWLPRLASNPENLTTRVLTTTSSSSASSGKVLSICKEEESGNYLWEPQLCTAKCLKCWGGHSVSLDCAIHRTQDTIHRTLSTQFPLQDSALPLYVAPTSRSRSHVTWGFP